MLSGVQGFLLSRVTAQDNGQYGLFPTHSSDGVIERCQASGHNDTGIYVGQSHDVTVRQSVAFANVNGIEFENSQDLRALSNETYDNVVGILVVLLPGLDVKTTTDVLVSGNRVHDNNHVNFAPAGDLASFVPSGSGILVVGAKHTRLVENTVTGNQFTGIALGSTLLLGALAGLPPSAFQDIDPDPAHVQIAENTVLGNGRNVPDSAVAGGGSPVGRVRHGQLLGGESVQDELPRRAAGLQLRSGADTGCTSNEQIGSQLVACDMR